MKLNINELRESFNYLIQRHYEVQGDIRMAIILEDYWEAVRVIDKFIKFTIDMTKEYRKTANYENINICVKADKMAKKIRTAHLEVEQNMEKKQIEENKSKFKLSLRKSTSQNILGILVTSK